MTTPDLSGTLLIWGLVLWTVLFGPATAIIIGAVSDMSGPLIRIVGSMLAFVLGGPLVWVLVLVSLVAAAVRRS